MFSARNKKSHYDQLYSKWTKRHKKLHDKLIRKHGQAIAHATTVLSSHQIKAGMLGGMMLLSLPNRLPVSTLSAHTNTVKQQGYIPDSEIFVVSDLSSLIPSDMQPLTPEQDIHISKILSRDYHMPVSSQLDGIQLNRTYGVIGAEQHLYRYPGDTLDNHVETTDERALFYDSGMAPGLGAYGYFAPSQTAFSEQDKLREKYYIAVQTFLAPGFSANPSKYYEFFRYRKMLVVNPATGQAVVCDIADAGPAEWTGKSLGGSPEVMYYLGLADGPRKGPVLYYFINDPNDTIPLGPVNQPSTITTAVHSGNSTG